MEEVITALKDTTLVPFNRASKMAIEFYQGFTLALDEVDQNSIQADIFVFDTKNSPSTTRKILNANDFPDMDIIIGPIFNKNLRIAAEYCKHNKIPMISPLSSSSSVTNQNPYYHSANGTSQSHYEALAHHITKKFPNDRLYIIHNGSQQEREIIDS